MRRTTLYFWSSWGLSLAVHATVAVWLVRLPAPTAAADTAVGREILLAPRAAATVPPAVPQPEPNPPPLPPPEPPPEPDPQTKPEPPPPEELPAVLGVDESDAVTKNWLGDAVATPFSGLPASQDQAQFTAAPGAPVVGAPATPPPSPSAVAPISPPVAPEPVVPTPAHAVAPAPTPEPPVSASEPSADSVPATGTPARPVPPATVVNRAGAAETPDARDALRPTEGLPDVVSAGEQATAPRASDPGTSTQIDATRAGELRPKSPPPDPSARADGEGTLPPRPLEAPPPAPEAPDRAIIDPDADEQPDPAPDNAAPDAPRDTPEPPTADDRPVDEVGEDGRWLQPVVPAPTPQTPPPASAAAQDPRSEPAPDTPAAPPGATEAEPAPLGAPDAGERAGIEADRESDAAAVIPIPQARLGKPIAARGLNIRTVRPRWSTTTLLTTSPRNPVVRIRFNRDGTVARAQFLEGMSTGSIDIDEPLLDALHRWRATGRQLDELPPGDARGVVVVMRIQLR